VATVARNRYTPYHAKIQKVENIELF